MSGKTVAAFIDFVVAEPCGINMSSLHHREFWPGSKWQCFLPDMDQTFRTSQLARTDRPGARVTIEHSEALDQWTSLSSAAPGVADGLQQRYAEHPMTGRPKGFFRMNVTESVP